jgi:hypothetical protein
VSELGVAAILVGKQRTSEKKCGEQHLQRWKEPLATLRYGSTLPFSKAQFCVLSQVLEAFPIQLKELTQTWARAKFQHSN